MQGRTGNLGAGFLLVVLLGAAVCAARPPRTDPAYVDVLQDGSVNGGLGEGGNHLSPADDPALAALEVQLLRQYANYNNIRSPWEEFLRADGRPVGNGNGAMPPIMPPQDKRQTRYRQCYFNPVSCFRK